MYELSQASSNSYVSGSCGILLTCRNTTLALQLPPADRGRNTPQHNIAAFDLYYFDQRSDENICLKDYDEGQRCKERQFSPI